MGLYIDQEYESNTLADLLVEAQEVTLEAWYRQLENAVEYSYRDLAKADIKAGRSIPADHPMFSLGEFVESPFELMAQRTVDDWGHQLLVEITKRPTHHFTKGDL